MPKIQFAKMCASGNDFIVIDNQIKQLPVTSRQRRASPSAGNQLPDFVEEICQRKKSVGADGVLLIENSSRADLKMRVFNPDGREVEMCGNGARCVALFAYRISHIAYRKVKIETKAGILEAEVTSEDRVRLKMPDPKEFRSDFNLEVEGIKYKVNYVNTGVPHVVRFVQTLDSIDVERLGEAIRYHEEFAPDGTNVDFVEVIDSKTLRVRTYERGVEAETLACGTGAAASAVVACLLGFTQPPTIVHTRGGSVLTICFDSSDSKITNLCLEGDTSFIYEGEIEWTSPVRDNPDTECRDDVPDKSGPISNGTRRRK